MRLARPWLVVAQGVVTIVLLTLVMRTIDLPALRALFARLPATFYLGSLAVIVGGQIAYAWRWRLLLHAAGMAVPFGTVLRLYFVGIFVNNFLPSSIGGDVAKVVYLGRERGYRTIAASVVVDRILGVGMLAMLAAGAAWLGPVASPRLVAAGGACAIIASAAFLLLLLAGFGTGGLAARVAPLGATAVRLAGGLQRLRLDMAAPLAQPRVILQAAVVVAAYAAAMTIVYLRFIALQHEPLPPFVALFAVVTATAVLSNVPVSLNGLGLREQLHAALLAPLGIAAESAVAISLLLYAYLLVSSAIGLVLWLRLPKGEPQAPADV